MRGMGRGFRKLPNNSPRLNEFSVFSCQFSVTPNAARSTFVVLVQGGGVRSG
jgi:hypothetical protein